jgi:predicted DNA-binding transcriptional regulator AlpA
MRTTTCHKQSPEPVAIEGLWSVAMLRQRIGISPTTIHRLVRRGTLPAIKINRRILFRPSSIEEFIRDRESGASITRPRGRRPGGDRAGGDRS